MSDDDPVTKNHALESQKEEVAEKSGKNNPIQRGVFLLLLITSILVLPNLNLCTSNCNQGGITGSMNNVQKYATLQLLRKMRDDNVCYILYPFQN